MGVACCVAINSMRTVLLALTKPTLCDLPTLARRCPHFLAHRSVLPHCNVLQGVPPPGSQEAPDDSGQRFHGHCVCAGDCGVHFFNREQRVALQAIWGQWSSSRALSQQAK
jgi:hypothetical protein